MEEEGDVVKSLIRVDKTVVDGQLFHPSRLPYEESFFIFDFVVTTLIKIEREVRVISN